ncbi:MAG: hypothetical protein WCW84_14380 [Sulfurimonas sp.]|jgi:hypothetical protein
MTLKLEKMTPKVFLELKNILVQEFENGNMPEGIQSAEQIESIIGFLQALKRKDSTIIKIFRKFGFLFEDDKRSVFEKSIQTIAKSDQIEKIIQPNKEKKKKWITTKLSSYLFHIFPEAGEKVAGIIAKKLYDKYKNILICKLKRINTSPKVLELAQKHPNMDINRLVSLCVLEDKLELANDDLLWLDRIISIIICSEQNIKEETQTSHLT